MYLIIIAVIAYFIIKEAVKNALKEYIKKGFVLNDELLKMDPNLEKIILKNY